MFVIFSLSFSEIFIINTMVRTSNTPRYLILQNDVCGLLHPFSPTTWFLQAYKSMTLDVGLSLVSQMGKSQP